MSDILKQEKLNIYESISPSFDEVRVILPTIKPHSSNFAETIKEMDSVKNDIEIMLNPVLERQLEGENIRLGMIDTMISDDQYPYSGNYLKKRNFPQVANPYDVSPIFLTPIASVSLHKLAKEKSYETGYRIHLYTPFERLHSNSTYLSEIFHTKDFCPGYQFEEKVYSEDYTREYTFFNKNFRHSIILHSDDQYIDFSTFKRNILKLQTDVVLAPKSYEAFQKEPEKISVENDIINEEIDLNPFMETATSLLRLGDFILEYKGKELYKRGDSKKFVKKLELGSFTMSYTGDENFPGVELFLGLLNVILKEYSFKMETIEGVGYDKRNRDMLHDCIKGKSNYKSEKCEIGKYHYRTNTGTEIHINNEPRENHCGKGRVIWNIFVQKDSFEEIINIITKTSKGVLTKNLFGASINKAHPKGFAYYINVQKVSDIIF